MSNDKIFLARFAEYQSDVESTVLSDIIDTTEEDGNVLPDDSDTSDFSSNSSATSDTSDFDSEFSDESADSDDMGVAAFGHTDHQNTMMIMNMYHGAADYLKPQNNLNCHTVPRSGCSNRIISDKDYRYFERVIKTHNDLQDLLVNMLNEATTIFGIPRKAGAVYYEMTDFDLINRDRFATQLDELKTNMLATIDTINSVYNEIIRYMNRNPSERTVDISQNMDRINYNWNLFLVNRLPLVPTEEDLAHYERTGTHRQLNYDNIIPQLERIGQMTV
jgi:hypothetical protein